MESLTATSTTAPKPGLSASSRLLVVLIKTFFSLGLGYGAVKFKAFMPEKGHTAGLGWYVGKVGLPLLIFKTIATASLGDVHLWCVVVTSGAKMIVYGLTGFITFIAYRTDRSRGQRMLTANAFATFAIATMDFPMGLPVMQALYGDEMVVYIAANSLVGTAMIQPIVLILFECGKQVKNKEDNADESDDNAASQPGMCVWFLVTMRDIILSPLLCWTLMGVFYQLLLPHTLEHVGGGLQLPTPLAEVVDFATLPFAMMALLLTGTFLSASEISFWPAFLVTMKVIVCSYLSWALAIALIAVPDDKERQGILQDFSFFYGCIPAGTPALVFAMQFDPESMKTVAAGIFLGLMVSGPVMYTTAIFLTEDSESLAVTLEQAHDGATILNLTLGVPLCLLFVCTWRQLPFEHRFIAAYGFLTFAYSIADIGAFKSFEKDCRGTLGEIYLSLLQNGCRVAVVFLQVLQTPCARNLRWGAAILFFVVFSSPAMLVSPLGECAASRSEIIKLMVLICATLLVTVLLSLRQRLLAKPPDTDLDEVAEEEAPFRPGDTDEQAVNFAGQEMAALAALEELDKVPAPNGVRGMLEFTLALRLSMQVVNLYTEINLSNSNVRVQLQIIEHMLEQMQAGLLFVTVLGFQDFRKPVLHMLDSWVRLFSKYNTRSANGSGPAFAANLTDVAPSGLLESLRHPSADTTDGSMRSIVGPLGGLGRTGDHFPVLSQALGSAAATSLRPSDRPRSSSSASKRSSDGSRFVVTASTSSQVEMQHRTSRDSASQVS